jgi:hypothetical protein
LQLLDGRGGGLGGAPQQREGASSSRQKDQPAAEAVGEFDDDIPF